MYAFNQKPRYASRRMEWLTSGGRATRSMAERFLGELSQHLQAIDGLAIDGLAADPPGQVDTAKPPRLLPFRYDLLKLITHQETIPIVQRYLTDRNPLIRSVAIWILGKQANRIVLLGLDKHCADPSPQVRKHLAKALRRLEAWQALQTMAAEYHEDAQVAWFARLRPNQKNYHDRLTNYTNSVDQTHRGAAAGPSRMPLWFRDEYWSGAPPKSIAVKSRLAEIGITD